MGSPHPNTPSSDNNEESPFDGFTGNIQYRAGYKAKKAIDAANAASALFDVVQTLVRNPSDDQIRTANSVMATLGGPDGMRKFAIPLRYPSHQLLLHKADYSFSQAGGLD
ncbi:hypothetical protein ACJ41O_011706 [Fusarium nematophilum]